jgi:hypothetical protein
MEIGEPPRTITVEPLDEPVPRQLAEQQPEERPQPEPPEPEKVRLGQWRSMVAPDYAPPRIRGVEKPQHRAHGR